MKPGDKVKRIAASWGVAECGGIYTVDYITGASNNLLHIIEDTDRNYDASAFIVIESSNSIEPAFLPEFLN